MQANTHTPAVIFGSHVRYVVPLFQRPYVWTEDEQWGPLWDDVRTLAERVLEAPIGYGAAPVATHFLGAIVLDQQPNPAGFIQVRHVVDGQQRLRPSSFCWMQRRKSPRSMGTTSTRRPSRCWFSTSHK